MLAFNVYAKKDKRMNERTNEVNGIFSRIYIYTSVREEDIIGDMKSGLPFFFRLLFGNIHSLVVCVEIKKEENK
jgi:hypothetical protein